MEKMDPNLLYGVTGFGFLLALLSFLVIFLGKRIPGDTGSPQEVEFKGFKMKTNTVVTLLVICVVVTVLPLSLQALLIYKNPSSGPVVSIQKGMDNLYITGQVLDEHGVFLEGAKVTVTNRKDQKTEVASLVTNASGNFYFPPLPFVEGDEFILEATKEGHVEQSFRVGPPNSVTFVSVLVAKQKKGGGL